MRRSPFLLLTALLYLGALTGARAVVVATGDGTQNATAPVDDFGFANVGKVYNSFNGFFNSGVYLGNGWVLTAYHVVQNGSGGFLFNDVVFRDPVFGETTFAVNASTAVRLQNADTTFTDLAMFRLTTTPTFLSPVTIASSLPSSGSAIVMAGDGQNRQPGLTYWEIDNSNNWSETTPGLAEASGYKELQGNQSLRWGTNTIESGPFVLNLGLGNVTLFDTDFDNATNEAQGSPGDSGGGVFYKNGSTWELVGILDATGEATGQPGFTAVFGNETAAVSLPTYRSQIVATIPEPGCVGLGLVGIAVLGWRRRRT